MPLSSAAPVPHSQHAVLVRGTLSLTVARSRLCSARGSLTIPWRPMGHRTWLRPRSLAAAAVAFLLLVAVGGAFADLAGASAPLRLSPLGVGPVRFGMTAAQAGSALHASVKVTRGASGCSFWTVSGFAAQRSQLIAFGGRLGYAIILRARSEHDPPSPRRRHRRPAAPPLPASTPRQEWLACSGRRATVRRSTLRWAYIHDRVRHHSREGRVHLRRQPPHDRDVRRMRVTELRSPACSGLWRRLLPHDHAAR